MKPKIDIDDLYGHLGFEPNRDAGTISQKEISQAYRREAKIHHPDRSGDRIMFERVQLAYEVLSDPERRRVYDETGRYDDQPTDNLRAAALARIMQEIGSHFDRYIASNFAPDRDPRILDLMGLVGEAIMRERDEALKSFQIGQRAVAFYLDMEERFVHKGGGPNAIADRIAAKIKESEDILAELNKQIGALNYAIEVAGEFKFMRETSYAAKGLDLLLAKMT